MIKEFLAFGNVNLFCFPFGMEEQENKDLSSSSFSSTTYPPKVEEKKDIPICRHWQKRGFCFYYQENKCRFSHPPEAKGEGDKKLREGGARGFSKARNGDKAGVFRRW